MYILNDSFTIFKLNKTCFIQLGLNIQIQILSLGLIINVLVMFGQCCFIFFIFSYRKNELLQYDAFYDCIDTNTYSSE